MKSKKKLKIALVAPGFGDIGGPEVVVQNLTEAFLKLGVDVTLFAPADWKTKAKHIPTLKKSLWKMKDFSKQDEWTRRNYIIASQTKVLSHQDDFDVIHLNSQRYAYLVAANLRKPCILSFHNPIMPWQYELLRKTSLKMVSLSKSQKGKFKTFATINNGIPVKNIPFSLKKGSYLMTIGRLTDQKGIDTAIKIAKKTNKKLLIFGRVGNSEKRKVYFEKKIKPFLDGKQIIYKGEVSHKQIYSYLKKAEALLFTIRRPESFGLVAAEALACGTPVIGTKIDPLPEIFSKKNGSSVSFISNNFNLLVVAVKEIDKFDREKCRKYAEENFDSLVMAKKYLSVYKKIAK